MYVYRVKYRKLDEDNRESYSTFYSSLKKAKEAIYNRTVLHDYLLDFRIDLDWKEVIDNRMYMPIYTNYNTGETIMDFEVMEKLDINIYPEVIIKIKVR